MKFGFLAHPTSRRGQAYVRAIDLMNKLIDEGEHGYRRETWQRSDQIPFFEAGVVRSLTGAECGGLLYEFPLTAQEILKGVVAAQAAVVRAVNTLEAAGADLVGLGGATSIVGGRGVVTQSEVSVPVTSGNSLTTFAAHAELKHVMDVLGVAPGQARVAVLGYPGSIALAIARMLIADGVAVDLVHSGRSSEAILKRHLGDSWTGAELFSSVEPCYERDRLFVTATSSGDVIDEERLAPGSVVVDVALPRDVIRARRPREDVLTIDGGFVSADPGVMLGATLGGMTVSRHINGCLAETVILGLEGLVESYSIGRELPLDKVRRIGEIAAKHGFVPLPMSSWEEQIGDSDIERLGRWWEAAARPKTAAADISAGMALERWKRFSDRLLVNHMRFNYIDVVLEHGRGCEVSSAEADYLDMDAGHGTAILGHDDPGVREAVLAHLNDSPVTAATLCL
ncbi:MAG: hypothetical protein LBT54_05330, partial [Bifidobacteriaceae bacterium]|nr:hypothetical protein [Bifidobacteriaceae bacterium]